MNKNTIVQKSIKWSGLAEIGNKLILPISTMILARILTPTDFGVVAICNMIILFADIISDAGFGKYIVQTEFKDSNDRINCTNVAFWSHMALAVSIWIIVAIFRTPIAKMLGNAEYSDVIVIACLQIIAMSFSSVPLALLRREFQFQKTFYVRMSAAIVPLIITIPLALVLRSYWALIIGNIAGATVSAILLLILSKWHPKLYYSWDVFKRMFNFSFWSLCEGLAHWAIFWFDTFLVSYCFTSYYLGLYKNSSSMMISLFGVITATMSPVLLSILSRMKNDDRNSFELISNIEKITLYLVLPMGIIIYFYRHLAVLLMFGDKWAEAADIVGAWALMMVISILFYSFPAEAFKSRGIPKYLFFYQISYLILLVPLCYYATTISFWTFVYARTGGIVIQVILFLMIFYKFIRWNRNEFLKSFIKPIIASTILAIICYCLTYILNLKKWYEIIPLVISLLAYLLILIPFRKDILSSISCIQSKNIRNA